MFIKLIIPIFFVFSICFGQLEIYLADPEVRISQKIYCQIQNIESGDQLQASLDDEIIYSKSGNLQAEEIFIADYRNLNAGSHSLVIQVLNQSNIVKAEYTYSWTTLHDGIPMVGINANNAICVNGELIFPVYAPVEEYTKDWAEHGLANSGSDMRYLHSVFSDYTVQEYQTWLDDCVDWGIKNIGPTHRWAGHFNAPHGKDNDLTIMQNYVTTLRDHEGVLMWQWADEPDGGGTGNAVEPDELRSWTDLCHEYDTNHPHAVNLTAYAWARDGVYYINHCQKYSYLYGSEWHNGEKKLAGDIIGFDFYPIEYATKIPEEFGDLEVNFETMAKAVDRIREYNYDLAPVFSWNENCDLHPDNNGDGNADGPGSIYAWTPPPTADEMWAEYWIKVIHGIKGFKIHTAFDTDCRGFDQFSELPRNHDTMQKFLTWMDSLKYAVLGEDYSGNVVKEEINGGRVDIMVKQYHNYLYIFAANLRRQSTEVQFTINSLQSNIPIEVYGEERTINSDYGSFHDSFNDIEVHIYKIPAFFPNPEKPENLHIKGSN